MCPAVVPCATADEESGSSIKIGVLCGPTLCVIQYQENLFWKSFLSNKPLHKKIAFRKLNPSLILDVTDALYTVYTPSVGVVGLAKYVCTHHILNFYRGGSRIYSRGRWVGVPFCTQPFLWLGSPAGSFVWRKTLMTSSWFTFLFGFYLLSSR